MGKIMHGNQVYSGGGGSVVEANPSDTAGADLTKIKIDGSTYAIPQGGGGGSNVTVEPLYIGGVPIANIIVDGTLITIYAPEGGGEDDMPIIVDFIEIQKTNYEAVDVETEEVGYTLISDPNA